MFTMEADQIHLRQVTKMKFIALVFPGCGEIPEDVINIKGLIRGNCVRARVRAHFFPTFALFSLPL